MVINKTTKSKVISKKTTVRHNNNINSINRLKHKHTVTNNRIILISRASSTNINMDMEVPPQKQTSIALSITNF